MNTLVASLLSFVLLAQTAYAAPGRVVTLVLPRTLEANETAWIELKVGVISKSAEIEIETTEGRMLGVISPYGIRPGNEAGTYTVPLPEDAISNKGVSVRIPLSYLQTKRAPTSKEPKSVRLKIGRS